MSDRTFHVDIDELSKYVSQEEADKVVEEMTEYAKKFKEPYYTIRMETHSDDEGEWYSLYDWYVMEAEEYFSYENNGGVWGYVPL